MHFRSIINCVINCYDFSQFAKSDKLTSRHSLRSGTSLQYWILSFSSSSPFWSVVAVCSILMIWSSTMEMFQGQYMHCLWEKPWSFKIFPFKWGYIQRLHACIFKRFDSSIRTFIYKKQLCFDMLKGIYPFHPLALNLCSKCGKCI